MEITFALLPEELLTYNQFVINRVPAFRLHVGLRFVSVPFGIVLLFLSQHFSGWICGLAGMSIAVVWIPFCLWSARFQFLQKVKKQRGLLDKQTVNITAEGVRQITSRVNSLMQWSSFAEIVESASQILFFLDKRHALIVPKRAFGNLEAAKQFAEAAQRYKAGLDVENAVTPSGVWPPAPRMGG